MLLINRITFRARMLVAGSLMTGALLIPLSAMSVPAGAASSSPFCTAVFSWAYHPVSGPTSVTIASYRKWSKAALPYYEKMEATAPNAKTKQILGFLVTVLKAYSNSTSLTKLAMYEKVHHTLFESDVKVLSAAIRTCVTSGNITLP